MSHALPPIAALVPHRPPMLLVDELVSQEGRTIVCRATIRGDHLFLEEDGAVPALVAVELFAQTAAALVGLLAPPGGPSMQSGALLGSREVRLHTDALRVGDVVDIRCTEAWTIGPAAQIECVLLREGAVIAEGSINVMAGDPEGAARARAERGGA